MLELLAETSSPPLELSNPFVLLMLLAVLAAAFVIYSAFKCGYLPPPRTQEPPKFLRVPPQEATGPDPHFMAPAGEAGRRVEVYIGRLNLKLDGPGLPRETEPFKRRITGLGDQGLEPRDPW